MVWSTLPGRRCLLPAARRVPYSLPSPLVRGSPHRGWLGVMVRGQAMRDRRRGPESSQGSVSCSASSVVVLDGTRRRGRCVRKGAPRAPTVARGYQSAHPSPPPEPAPSRPRCDARGRPPPAPPAPASRGTHPRRLGCTRSRGSLGKPASDLASSQPGQQRVSVKWLRTAAQDSHAYGELIGLASTEARP